MSVQDQTQVFAPCRRVFRRARRLLDRDDLNDSQRLLSDFSTCLEKSCPRRQQCQRYVRGQGLAVPENKSDLVDWQTMSRRPNGYVDIDGHRLTEGFEQHFAARDHWENRILHQQIAKDVAWKYETSSFRALLRAWYDLENPSLSDFNFAALNREDIEPWLHIFEFGGEGGTRFKRYAPRMTELSGRDDTNTSIMDFPIRKFAELIEQVQDDLIEQRKPKYGYVVRQLNFKGSRREAAMRRLELPYFSGDMVVGSIVMLKPEAA